MKKGKKHKFIKILVGILVVFEIFILWIINGLYGNPISRMRVNYRAEEYIAEQYGDMELEVAKASYNFKFSEYWVRVKSLTSIDTHFYIAFNSDGTFRYDTYEDDVLGKFNTYMRIEEAYRKAVDEVLESEHFPYKGDILFGTLKERERLEVRDEDYGLSMDELIIDKEYNIMELGKEVGTIVLYIEDENVTIQRMVEVLLGIKEHLEGKGISYYAIDLTLQEPRKEGVSRQNQLSIGVEGFKYTDLYEEGLEERVEEAVKSLEEYYKKQDEIKQEEILQYEES